MSKDKHFERRMILNKYSNRPPFNLKKPHELYDVEDKIKSYPEEICKSCCKNKTKEESHNPKKQGKSTIPQEDPTQSSKTAAVQKVIPKVLESFQKLTPAESYTLEGPTMRKTASVQTLYRNTKTIKLGKNIPKHKLMKSLLQNLDSNLDGSKRSSAEFSSGQKRGSKGGARRKKSKKMVRSDLDASIGFENSEDVVKKISKDDCYTATTRADKKTSTTGLVWPPKSKEMLRYPPQRVPSQPQNKISSQVCQCCRFPSNAEDLKNNVLSSESFLEEAPTREAPQRKPWQIEGRQLNNKCKERKSEWCQQKSVPFQSAPTPPNTTQTQSQTSYQVRQGPVQKPSKGKTFVQAQVEKLDKVLRNPKLPNSRSGGNQGLATAKREMNSRLGGNQGLATAKREVHSRLGGNQGLATAKREVNLEPRTRKLGKVDERRPSTNHTDLMDVLRNNYPVYDDWGDSDSFSSEDDQDWSDATNTDVDPRNIRFPKETKAAVDQILGERERIPLSKFTNVYQNCRPAINDQAFYHSDHFSINQQGDFNRPVQRKPSEPQRIRNRAKSGLPALTRPSLSDPCKKNLLCDQGDHHAGPCGYTRNHNKVIY